MRFVLTSPATIGYALTAGGTIIAPPECPALYCQASRAGGGVFAPQRRTSTQKLNTSEPEVRVLVLLPGKRGDDIRIQLHLYIPHRGATNEEQYEAVSYAWGSASAPALVTNVLAPARQDAILVTRNLYELLNELRYETRSRVLWVDAICIDRGDVSERSHQVQQMRAIYSRAQRVIFWFGPLTNSVRLLMNYLDIL